MSDPAMPDPSRVALLTPGASPADRALAGELSLPVTEIPDRRFPLLLMREGGALQLRWSDPAAPGPVRVDFAAGDVGRRLRTATSGQPLGRAVGFHRGLRRVLDATAGLGADAATLAALGCHVTAVERHPVVAALLHDGLCRALQHPGLAETVSRIALLVGDARQVMRRLPPDERPEVVFLDPMFPKRGSAQVKKHSQLLRALLCDTVEPDLLAAALDCARKRVVVKRHPHAEPLGTEPDLVVTGNRVRYDVYLVR